MASVQECYVSVVNGINCGADALSKGDLRTADRLFTVTLKNVRESLRSWQHIRSTSSTSCKEDDGSAVPVIISDHDSGLHPVVCPLAESAACLSSLPAQAQESTPPGSAYLFCRKVRLSADHLDASAVLRSPEATFHCLSGFLVYNIALLYHVKAGLCVRQDDRDTASEYLNRAVQLYLNADRLLCSSSPQDQQRDVVRSLAIWNNLSYIHALVNDDFNAVQCSQRVLNMLSQLSHWHGQHQHGCDTCNADVSVTDFELFFESASSVMMGQGHAPAAAAA